MQIVFQDPYSSLNARMSIGTMLQEPMIAHNIGTKQEIAERTDELLHMVGLKSFHAHRYPHEFSGGQRQRIVIAISLTADPDILICDEPTTALDVTIQAQVLRLLKNLHRSNSAVLLITHDLGVVSQMATRLAVMKDGRVVETSERPEEFFNHPQHPYSRALVGEARRMELE